MDAQKEALRRIIITLTSKNQELRDFLQSLDWTRTGLKEESCHVMSELEAELELLNSTLEEKGAELRSAIIQSHEQKEAELQAQHWAGQRALSASEELLTFANSALDINDNTHFLQVAKEIKERVTMASSFRISTRPVVSENMSHFAVDFSAERAGLHTLNFLPAPPVPILDVSRCFIRDNIVFVQWSSVDQSGATYELQFRKSDQETTPPSADACWEKIQGIRDTHSAISGLRLDSRFVEVRVRARNKAAAGEFSEMLQLETKAFHFSLDSLTAHPELSVQSHSATWRPKVKEHDPRIKSRDKTSGRSATPSPVKSSSSRAWRERFAGESYTVLGDQEISGGGHYWEVRPTGDWKAVSVGVAYRGALSRFVQLGKSPASWSLSLSQWLQSSVSAKHNNRSKSLDSSRMPQRVGVYCHHGNGDLLFMDVDQTRLIHSFRTKFSQSLVPAFTVWFGGVAVETGLQVPSFIDQLLPVSAPPTSAPPTAPNTPEEEDLSPDRGPGSDPGPDPGSDPGPDRGPGSDPGPDPGSDPGPDRGPGLDPGPDPGSDPGPDRGPGSDPGPDPGSDPGPDPGSDPRAQTRVLTRAQTQVLTGVRA
ncbi:FSD1-like protein [Eucyclogobius newberryi]|uniref:FSD1-like protein n=1 Tax=Eucyclogobius newberryi TaxID=166745 RepID=UPI003B59B33D